MGAALGQGARRQTGGEKLEGPSELQKHHREQASASELPRWVPDEVASTLHGWVPRDAEGLDPVTR